MRLIPFYLVALLISMVLASCGDTYNDIKQAAAGIQSKANEATTAISADVHAIRATMISYNEQTFTINDLFKTILRDVQWFYDEKTNQLTITGTWMDNGLFAEQQFSDDMKQSLQHEGEVTVVLVVEEQQVVVHATQTSLTFKNNTLVTSTGKQAFYQLVDVYIAQ